MKRFTISLLIPAILALQPASAEIIDPSDHGECDGGCGLLDLEAHDLYEGNCPLSLRQLTPLDVEKWLTFKDRVHDGDKDGFLEGARWDVNPTGYVVFHARSMWLNQRITLGHGGGGLLAVAMMSSPGGGPPPEPEPVGRGQDGPPDPSPLPPVPPSPAPVPEPAAAILLAAGPVILLYRRRK
ncbi:MAG: hypothetical protein ACYS5V_09035 [Planctomycetota bacterium]